MVEVEVVVEVGGREPNTKVEEVQRYQSCARPKKGDDDVTRCEVTVFRVVGREVTMVVTGDGDGVLKTERQGSPVTPGENYHDDSQALVRGQIRSEQIESELFV